MKTLTAVVVFILLAITAGGISGYFLYTDLVKNAEAVIIQQRASINKQSADIRALQMEINLQDREIRKNHKDVETLAGIILKLLGSVSEQPSKLDNSSFGVVNCTTFTGTCITPSSW